MDGPFCRAFAFSTLRQLPPSPLPDGLEPLGAGCPEAAELRAWVEQLGADGSRIVGPIASHLSRSRAVAVANLRAAADPFDPRESRLDDSLVGWGYTVNVIWVTSDQRALDPEGRLLLDGHGHSPNRDAVIPCPVDARRRKVEMEVRLRNRMIDPPDGLLPLPGSEEIEMVAPAEVARRALALFLCATRAESILTGQPLEVQRMRARSPMGFAALTNQEQAFFDLPVAQASQPAGLQSAGDFVWRYESLMTLQWALDMQFELAWPDERADLTSVTRLMIDLPDAAIVEQARLRTPVEILDAAELHYQAMQAIVDAQSSGRDLSDLLDAGVVCERLIALAWILGSAPALSDRCPPDWDGVVQWVENGCMLALPPAELG